MRKLSADKIFTGHKFIEKGVVIIDDKKSITAVLNNDEGLQDVEYFSGILCPGFINTHCHLELSHMKGLVSEGKGLVEFIKELQTQREADPDKVQQAIIDADSEMLNNGIVAVGDISNGSDSFATKVKSKMKYHTFVELYGFLEAGADDSFDKGLALAEILNQLGLDYSLVPHSPYASSKKLIKLISDHSKTHNIVAMHNQETLDENELFEKGSGGFIDLMQWFGIDTSFWNKTEKSSLASIIQLLPKTTNLLFVHNTFTTQLDLDIAQHYNPNIYWALCPNANKYIENKVPDFDLFVKNKLQCTIGTDSLTSNWSLSVMDELKTIKKENSGLSTETLLKWATQNGAKSLNLTESFGSIEKGKTPGINLLYDLENFEISEATKVKKLA